MTGNIPLKDGLKDEERPLEIVGLDFLCFQAQRDESRSVPSQVRQREDKTVEPGREKRNDT